MNINKFLKSIGVPKYELAEMLEISRPTLNMYINKFETGEHIENERYDIIFNRLFSGDIESKEQFDERMQAVMFLLKRDRKYDIDILEPEAADIAVRVHDVIVKDMALGDWNHKVYDYVLMIINNYRKNQLFENLAAYFSDLNSDSNVETLSEVEKRYYAYFFRMFSKITNSMPELDEKDFCLFVDRKNAILRERKIQNENRVNKIKEKLDETVKSVQMDYLIKGIDASEDEIMEEVVRRVRNR